jgi:hypothetical protein
MIFFRGMSNLSVPLTDNLALQNDENKAPEWPAWDRADYAILDLFRAWIEGWKSSNCTTPHLRGVALQLR